MYVYRSEALSIESCKTYEFTHFPSGAAVERTTQNLVLVETHLEDLSIKCCPKCNGIRKQPLITSLSVQQSHSQIMFVGATLQVM